MSTPKTNGGNVQSWAPQYRIERGTPMQSRNSLPARLPFKARQILQSLKDVLVIAAAIFFCLSAAGSIIVFFVMLLLMRF